MKKDVNQILQRAKEKGKIYLASLSKEELEKVDPDIVAVERDHPVDFAYVDVYLVYNGDEYALELELDGGNSGDYYLLIGNDEEAIIDIIKSYLGEDE